MTARHTITAGIRRTVVLLLLVGGLVVGSALPSWASFTATTAVPTMSIATATVDPVGNLTARVRCTGNTASVTLNWNASASARVTGYRVRVYLGTGYQEQATLAGAGTTTWSGSADTYYVTTYVMTFTVWTLTDYGWTTESVKTPRIVC
jgi:hypothetical protein